MTAAHAALYTCRRREGNRELRLLGKQAAKGRGMKRNTHAQKKLWGPFWCFCQSRLAIFISVGLLSLLSSLLVCLLCVCVWLILRSASIFVFQSLTVSFLSTRSPAASSVSTTQTDSRCSFLSCYHWLKQRPRGLSHDPLLKHFNNVVFGHVCASLRMGDMD